MIGLAIDLGICAVALALLFAVAGFTGLLKLFLMRITILNGIFFSVLITVILLFGRMEETPYTVTLNPFVCILIGIGVYLICHLAQKTQVGFWIFAVIMSPIWAAILATISYFLSERNQIVFWVLLIVLTVINIYLHIRSRKYRFELAG